MKKTIILASVAIATLFAFSSCQKEELEKTSVSGVRVITAEFENNGTKTTLNADGKTPEWAEGDKIRILNGTTYQDVTLSDGNITNNKITFTTSLGGTLYAVYPASATTMTSCSGSITFTIPAIQDGTFASANICVAKSSTTDGTNKDKLVFSNATSVLEFSQTAATTQVLSVRVEATNAIAGPMTVNYKSDGTFDPPTTSSLSGKNIRVKSATAVDKYYIAVAPVATGKIEFEYQKAVEVATVTTEAGKTLAANTIYTCPTMDGPTYEIKQGSINGYDYVQVGSVKWATMNVGATTVADSYATCYGDLYEWGSVETIYKERPWTSATEGNFTNKWKDGKENGYAWPTYCEKSSFEEWNPAPYDDTKILKPEKDAATQNWGTDWRMPTSAEFTALYEACGKTGSSCTPTSGGSSSTTVKGVYWCSNYNSVAGCLFIVEDNGPHLFFPAAGFGYGTSLYYAGSYGYYWSSSLNSFYTNNAYFLYFRSSSVGPQDNYNRCTGRSVRPVSD